jgi:hypothetical protein
MMCILVGRNRLLKTRPRRHFEDVSTSTTLTKILFTLRQEVSKKGYMKRGRESEWNFENPFDEVSSVTATEHVTRSLSAIHTCKYASKGCIK